jgi:hypothetical protein
VNTFSESVKEFGLFNFVSREMRRKRESYPAQQGHWVAPLPESRLKERPVAPRHELESFGKPRPIEPVKPLLAPQITSMRLMRNSKFAFRLN